MRIVCKVIVSVVTVLFFSTMVYAASSGYSNDISDARSLGNANAVVARPVSPATNWFNPAGLTKLAGTQISITGMIESVKTNFSAAASGNKVYAKDGLFYVPSIFYSQNLDNQVVLGLGLNSPYGLTTEWNDPLTNYVTTDVELKTFNFNPNIAYALNDTYSIAVGADVTYAAGDLNKLLSLTGLNASLLFTSTGTMSLVPYPDGKFQLKGKDTAVGGNVALLVTPNEKVSLGLSYRSTIDLNMQGKLYLRELSGPAALIFGGTEYEAQASLRLATPETITGGIAFTLLESTTVELDIEWARWSEIDTFHIQYRDEANPLRLAVLNTGNPVPKNWDDTFNVALGVEHKLNDKWTIYAGTRYRPSPVPDKSFDPIVPALDLIDLEGGFSVNFGESSVDVCLAYVHGKERDVQNTVGNDVGTSINGKYKVKAYVLGVTYTRKL